MRYDHAIEFERQSYKKEEKRHWLIDVLDERKIQTLVEEEHIYALDDYSLIREFVKPGDSICFALYGQSVMAHAEVESGPMYKLHYKVADPVSYPWVITLKNVHTYVDNPVRINSALLMQLDFRPKPVLCIRKYEYEYKLKEHDFFLLTRSTT